MQDDDAEAILAADFEIGHFLRERIVPRSVLYFTGEAIEDDDDDVSIMFFQVAQKLWNNAALKTLGNFWLKMLISLEWDRSMLVSAELPRVFSEEQCESN